MLLRCVCVLQNLCRMSLKLGSTSLRSPGLPGTLKGWRFRSQLPTPALGSPLTAAPTPKPHSASQKSTQVKAVLDGKLPDLSKTRGPTPMVGRKIMEDSVPLETFNIAGVSFEGRQAMIPLLHESEFPVCGTCFQIHNLATEQCNSFFVADAFF